MTEEKTNTSPLQDFDTDSYDDIVEVVAVEGKSPTKEINLFSAEAKDLLIYFANRFKETQGFEYNVEWVKEIAIFKSYKERYGDDAGPMVALLFDKYNGVFNGQVMTVTAFSKGSKWIQDKLYIELRQDIIKENEPRPNIEGLMNSDDFLKRLAL